MNIDKPKISICEDYDIEKANEEYEFKNYTFSKNCNDALSIKELTIDSCIFKKIDFSNIDLDVSLVDVIFDGCDLSNKKFDKKLLCRVEFRNCKMVGTSFIDSSLKSVLFINCSTKYLNFSNTRIEKMLVEDSNFAEASFMESDIKSIKFNKVLLERTEFFKVKLNKVDFSTCDISSTLFDMTSLKGIVVDRFQCASLVGMLGVNVKED